MDYLKWTTLKVVAKHNFNDARTATKDAITEHLKCNTSERLLRLLATPVWAAVEIQDGGVWVT